MEKNDIFDFMIEGIKEISNNDCCEEYKAFIKWFINIYFLDAQNIFMSDGSKDGKIDCFFNISNERMVEHYILNAKYTSEYDKIAPPKFYEEIRYFCHIFENKDSRGEYLEKAVKPELKDKYEKLFEYYDEGIANLIFITNYRKNDAHYSQVKKLPIKIFHLNDLIQFIVDDIDMAMPRTKDLILTGINGILTPDIKDTEVSTSIVFARLLDFINYMKDDPYDLLFARNVRLNLYNSPVNIDIKRTFEKFPKEFVFSNNGITILCEHHDFEVAEKKLKLINPRIVNGSQTLHSIRDVQTPSHNARIMLRIIEIPPLSEKDIPSQIEKKKDIINKISLRSNQQNPIKLWNLVANDDFQLELFRYFRRKNFFFERRTKEYASRSREFKNLGLKKGPTLQLMCQLISAYYWKDKKLGPAVARNLSKLFNNESYNIIKKTKPEVAYQLFLLDQILYKYFLVLSNSKKYAKKYKGYIRLSLFSLVIKLFEKSNIKLGEPNLSTILETYYNKNNNYKDSKLYNFVKLCVDFIDNNYKKSNKKFKVKEKYDLTVPNYFKSNTYMNQLLQQSISFSYKKFCNYLFKKN